MASPEESDTVSNSPTSIVQDYDDDFARLIPSNNADRLAFHALAELIKLDGRRIPHARRFVHLHPNRIALSPDTNTETDTSERLILPQLCGGHYRFNLDI